MGANLGRISTDINRTAMSPSDEHLEDGVKFIWFPMSLFGSQASYSSAIY